MADKCPVIYLSFGVNYIQPHLSIDRKKWFFTYNLFPEGTGLRSKNGGQMLSAKTYDRNRPLTRAMYSFRTVPAVNSEVNCRARSAERGMIINPEVNRSSRLTAVKELVDMESRENRLHSR
jgi:hypothetical protein